MRRTPHWYRHSSLPILSILFAMTRDELLTPPGMKWPSTVSPPSGTVLTKPIGALGKILSPSSMTADMYGSLLRSSKLRSPSDAKLVRTSSVSLSRTRLSRRRWLNRPARNPAVVSVPAMLHLLVKITFFDLICLHEKRTVDNYFVGTDGA